MKSANNFKRTLLYLTSHSFYLSNATYMKWWWQKPGAGSHSFHANFLVFTCQESVSTVPNKVSMSQQMTCQEKKAKQINEKRRHKLELGDKRKPQCCLYKMLTNLCWSKKRQCDLWVHWSLTAIFLWPWKMVSVSVRYLIYQPMDEKNQT